MRRICEGLRTRLQLTRLAWLLWWSEINISTYSKQGLILWHAGHLQFLLSSEGLILWYKYRAEAGPNYVLNFKHVSSAIDSYESTHMHIVRHVLKHHVVPGPYWASAPPTEDSNGWCSGFYTLQGKAPEARGSQGGRSLVPVLHEAFCSSKIHCLCSPISFQTSQLERQQNASEDSSHMTHTYTHGQRQHPARKLQLSLTHSSPHYWVVSSSLQQRAFPSLIKRERRGKNNHTDTNCPWTIKRDTGPHPKPVRISGDAAVHVELSQEYVDGL